MRSEDVQYIQCPGCCLELPADDTDAQVAHMEEYHPEIIAQRLHDEGLHHEADQFLANRRR